MPRPVSWLPRLHEITRSVTNSVRSHYDRRDIEALFQLQPRAAQKLLEILPAVQVGTSRLVDREALAGFLGRVRETDNITALLDTVRHENAGTSRRKIRSLVRRDVEPAGLGSLPANIDLTPGHMTVQFSTVEELAEAMLTLARILENEGDAFANLYEPPRPAPNPQSAIDVRSLFTDLEALERANYVAAII